MRKQDIKVQGMKLEDGINKINFVNIQPMTVRISDYIDVTEMYEVGIYLKILFSTPPSEGNLVIDFYEFNSDEYTILPKNQFYRQSLNFNQEIINEFLFTLKVEVSTQKFLKVKISNTTDSIINELEMDFLSSMI